MKIVETETHAGTHYQHYLQQNFRVTGSTDVRMMQIFEGQQKL